MSFFLMTMLTKTGILLEELLDMQRSSTTAKKGYAKFQSMGSNTTQEGIHTFWI